MAACKFLRVLLGALHSYQTLTDKVNCLDARSVTANLCPEEMHNLMVAALEKDVESVEQINKPLLGLHDKLFCESNPIPVKVCTCRYIFTCYVSSFLC